MTGEKKKNVSNIQETDLFQAGCNSSITNHLCFRSLKNLCLNTSHNLVCKLVTHKKVRGLTILAEACKGGKCLWCTTTHHTFQHSCMHKPLHMPSSQHSTGSKHLAEALVPMVLMCGSRDRLHDMTTGPTIRKRLIYKSKTCNDI